VVAAMGACVIRTSPIESSRTRPAAAYRCEGGVCSNFEVSRASVWR